MRSSVPPPAPASPGLTVLMGTHRVLRLPVSPLLPPTTAMRCPQPTWCLCPGIAVVDVRLGMACHAFTLPRATATSVASLLGLAHAHLGVCPGLCAPVVHGDRVWTQADAPTCAHSAHTSECTLVCTRVHVPMSACPYMCPCVQSCVCPMCASPCVPQPVTTCTHADPPSCWPCPGRVSLGTGTGTRARGSAGATGHKPQHFLHPLVPLAALDIWSREHRHAQGSKRF